MSLQGGFGIRVDVWDDDSSNFLGIGSEDDLVDKFQTSYGMAANRDAASATAYRFRLRGRRSSMGIIIR